MILYKYASNQGLSALPQFSRNISRIQVRVTLKHGKRLVACDAGCFRLKGLGLFSERFLIAFELAILACVIFWGIGLTAPRD